MSSPANLGRPVLALVIAYLLSRGIFALMHYHYDIFTEPFDLAKLAIDLGVSVLVYGAAFWILGLRNDPSRPAGS